MRRRFQLFVIALAVSLSVSSQAIQQREPPSDRDVANRIAELTARFVPNDDRRLPITQSELERNRITGDIRAEVTKFIEASVLPSQQTSAIQSRLRSVLAAHRPMLEYSDSPTARAANLRYGPSLVVAYTVVRPPHFDSALLFGFKDAGGRFQLEATTGEDFDGYTMFTLELPSPIEGELWLFAGGQALTFNGAKFRFRVYSFDGNGFRAVWSPDDFFNATVRSTPNGFAVTHSIREPPYTLIEEYATTISGVNRVK